jgi:hypothetical protein
MLASERRDLLLDFKDRLARLYIQKNAASKSGDWPLADVIDGEILEVKAQRAEIHDRDTPENP